MSHSQLMVSDRITFQVFHLTQPGQSVSSSSFQVILGIVFPPAILLLDFRLGDEASHHSPKENEVGRSKDEDNKLSKVTI